MISQGIFVIIVLSENGISPVPATHIPQPMPDPERLFHFRAVANTPSEINGAGRTPDDFQSRFNIKKDWNAGGLQTDDDIFK